jgi:malate synthase
MTSPNDLLVDEYSDLIFGAGVLEQDKQALIDSVITPEIKAKIAEIDAEFAPKLEALNEKKAELENILKSSVLHYGTTIKGKYHAFTFTKGRTSWDSKSLEGYAAAHPEILAFRTIGEPSVSVRKV